MDNILADDIANLACFQLEEVGSAGRHILDLVAAGRVRRMQFSPIIPIKAVRTQKRFRIPSLRQRGD
ncbi:hypothetical protein NKH53_30860 [Mesorhizobium australicum]|uniref:hypothetical protein n=1 Tax=Mesorhizobium australicum TaxID=536018 RepID=UPI00333C7CBE